MKINDVVELVCARCGAVKVIPKDAIWFDYWFCHRSDEDRRCWTMNTRKS